MWGISWANLSMLLATIPVYEADKKEPDAPKEVDGFDELAGLVDLT